MIPKSIRLPDDLVRDVDQLKGNRQFTEIATEALRNWVRLTRRIHEDVLIAQTLSGMSSEQRQEEGELTQLAQQSSLEILENLDVGSKTG